jgi:hypothetical protein
MSKLKKCILGIFAILGAAKTIQEIWSAFKTQITKICAIIIMIMTVIFSYISQAVEYWGYNLILISLLLIGYLWFAFLILVDRYKLAKQRRINEKEGNKRQMDEDSAQKQEIIRLISKTPLKNTVEQASLSMKLKMLAPLLSESTRILVEDIARIKIGENATQSQKSSIRTLLEGLDPFNEKVNLLIPKILEAIKNRSISKQAIVFLSSITDDDLEILKKQFRYVLRLPHQDIKSDISSKDLAIWHFEDNNSKIQNLLLKENGLMHLESYHIKFYGDIWVGEATRASTYLLKYKSDVIFDIDNRETALQICHKQEPVKGMIANPIVFSSYVCLSGVGMEIFNLLKDEIESTPQEYLNSLVKHWEAHNSQYNFNLIEKAKLITNDNP